MIKRVLLLVLSSFVFAEDLKTLLEAAKARNELLQAAKLEVDAKNKELQSVKRSYVPTLDLNAFYKRDDDPSPFQPGSVYGGGVRVGWEVYNGGKREATIKRKKQERSAKNFARLQRQNDIELQIVKTFYAIKSEEALLEARKEAAKAVLTQLERIKAFYAANLATSDGVARLQAAYDGNLYEIESLSFALKQLYKQLELLVGRPVARLQNASFLKEDSNAAKTLPSIKAIEATHNALLYAARAIQSAYYPNIVVEDTYNFYRYGDKPQIGAIPIELLEKQNSFGVRLSFRVFDYGVIAQQKEAATLQAAALEQEAIYKTKEQRLQLELAKERIQTAKANIKSAKSALKAALSAFETITRKYNASLVDNVTYLDALASKTAAKARYAKAKNDLETAYGLYYYYQGKNLEEMIR